MSIDILFLGGTSIDLIQNRQKGRSTLDFSASIGGSIANSCIIAAKLSLKAALLSRIGKGLLGDFVVEFLNACKIDTKSIIRDSNIRTPLAIAKIDKFGVAKYTFYKNPPEDSVVPLKSVPKYLLNTCKVFHVGSSYSYQKETFEETIKFIKYLKKIGIFISYDPNIRPNSITDKISVKNRVFSILKLANLAKLSEIDLEYLTGHKSPEKGLNELKKLANCELILTLGSKGSIYLGHNGLLTQIPAFKVKIADTIGAGDAFTAGLIYKLIKQGKVDFFANIKPNMIFASAVSAIICTKKGANHGLRDIKQVNSFLAKHLSG